MPRRYDQQLEDERRDREGPEQIRRLVAEKGQFTVTLRKRDNWLRHVCFELRRQKILKGGRREGSLIVFTAGENINAQAKR